MFKMEQMDIYFLNLRNMQNLKNQIIFLILQEEYGAIFYTNLLKFEEISNNYKAIQLIAVSEKWHADVLRRLFIEFTGENKDFADEFQENKYSYEASTYIECIKLAIEEKYKNIQSYNSILYAMMDRGCRWNILNIVNEELVHLSQLNQIYIETRLGETKNHTANRQLKEFTIEELAKYDGSGGEPAYVAVENFVYDVSNEAVWGGGTHFGLTAGKDFTDEFKGCHKVQSILEKLPKVGIIKR